MKIKRFLPVFFLLFFSQAAFSQENGSTSVPPLLEGIWQGEDRILMFSSKNEFALVLRVFYQWYNDRTGEPASFSEIKSRPRNDTTSVSAENIEVEFITLFENSSKTSGAYELSVKYPHEKERVFIPLCVIDGRIYLDFLIKGSSFSDDKSTDGSLSSPGQENKVSEGFFRCQSNASSIPVSLPVFKKETASYIFNENDIYKIRYWLSEMEESDIKVSFTDEENNKTFYADKFLKIGSHLYQCTTGRSTKIRNVEKISTLKKDMTYDSENMILALGKAYLEKVPEKGSADDLLESVEENNKRRKPAPKPLFPVSEINFHWKEISELEKYNPYTWNRRNIDIHK